MLASILLLIGGGVLLAAGGEALIRGATALGLHFGLSPLVVGLTIVAFGTSAPELAVSLDAALGGSSDVALGNVIGSNICNIGAVLGLCCLITPVQVRSQIVRIDAPIAIGAALLLTALLADGGLSRTDGGVLFALLAGYLLLQVQLAKQGRDALAPEFAELERALAAWLRSVPICLAAVVAGLALLVAGAELFVDGAVRLARLAGVTEAVIGLTIVALGTSLPELAATLVAAYRREADVAVGNVIGSNIFNVFSILGLSALVTPLSRGNITSVDLWTMVGISVLLWPVLYGRRLLARLEGAVLLAVYLAYMSWLVYTA